MFGNWHVTYLSTIKYSLLLYYETSQRRASQSIGGVLELPDSRPIWFIKGDTNYDQAFDGTTIMLPLLMITFSIVNEDIYYEL